MNQVPEDVLTPELKEYAEYIIQEAKAYGLTFYPLEFILLSPAEMSRVAAYGGFPNRMSHWSFGLEYNNIHKGYSYGASKIYELVINNDPVYAYLLTSNNLTIQKLVMCHVCGHADFFFNNLYFPETNRKMLDQMANNASRVQRIIKTVGESKVEDFMDVCFSLRNLIDPFSMFFKREEKKDKEGEDSYSSEKSQVHRLPAKPYMDNFINTKEFLAEQKKQIEKESKAKKKFPNRPEQDILKFLMTHAPLERWQKDILGMVREESYYFAPQRMTKIANEGWGSFIHSKLMVEKVATDCDIIDYCDVNAGVLYTPEGGFNPYKIGLSIFQDIEDRWNKGKFGLEWERCDDLQLKAKWDRKLNLGKEKVFQVRKVYNDIELIDEFLTPEFCKENNLFVYRNVEGVGFLEWSREFAEIKKHLLRQLTNGGEPIIRVIDGNYQNTGNLLLEHEFDGRELDEKTAQATLENIQKLWGRPVGIKTLNKEEGKVIWMYDGKTHCQVSLDKEAELEVDLEWLKED